MHTYDFHIGDYARDTTHLSLLEHGVYRLLLDRAYADEAPLPLDVPKLCRKLNARTAAEQKAVESVLSEFFTLTPEGYTHKRVIEEMGDARLRSRKSKFAQVLRWWRTNKWENEPTLETYLENPEAFHDPLSGHIRNPYLRTTNEYGKDTDAYDSNTPVYDRITPVANRNSYQPPTANRQPPTAKESNLPPKAPQGGQDPDVAGAQVDPPASAQPALTPKKKKGGAARHVAESIYALYPRKVGRDAALRAIERRLSQGVTPETLTAATKRFAQAVAQWPSTDRQYVPHPSTWFNQGRFDDDPREWSRSSDLQKNGSAAPADQPLQVVQRPLLVPPDGYERALEALYGPQWADFLPAWPQLDATDRAKVKAWLAQNPHAPAQA